MPLAFAQPTADELVKQIRAVKNPDFDASREGDEEYLKEFTALAKAAFRKRGDLVLDLLRAYPDDGRVPMLIEQRWVELDMSLLPYSSENLDIFQADVDRVLEIHSTPELEVIGDYVATSYQMKVAKKSVAKMLGLAGGFRARHPAEAERGMMLLVQAGWDAATGNGKAGVYREILRNYPKHPMAPTYQGALARHEAKGRVLNFSFKDAVTCERAALSSLRGKPVFILFWTSARSESRDLLDQLVALQKENPGKAAFIGINLDRHADEAAMKETLGALKQEKEMDWPLAGDLNGLTSSLAQLWGVMAVPMLVTIDSQGRLISDRVPEDLQAELDRLSGE